MKVMKFVYALTSLMFCMASNAGDKTNLENGTHTKVGISKDCTEAWCERYSFQHVAAKYSGLFLTKFEFLIEEMIFYLDRDVILHDEGVKNLKYIVGSDGDGDSCCTTKLVYRIYHDLKNVYGQKRSVVHLSNSKQQKYQFITEAECIGKGKCDGKCVLEDSVRTVLVYDGHTITFDQVMIPTYCSCKRIG